MTWSTKEVAEVAVGYQHAGQKAQELRELLDILVEIKPKRMLEIGSYAGGTYYAWHRFFPDSVIVCIDSCPKPFFKRLVNFDGNVLIERDSHDIETRYRAAKYGPFDFIFIDGDHAYEAVKEDYELYKELLSPFGVIAFHDILEHRNTEAVNVKRLWEEIKHTYPQYREIVHEHLAWGGIGLVYA